jgi:hypothetical protein
MSNEFVDPDLKSAIKLASRKRKNSTTVESLASASVTHRHVPLLSAFLVPQNPSRQMAAAQYSRSPALTDLRFTKYIVDCDATLADVRIRLENPDKIDVIQVATDWKEGQRLSKAEPEKAAETGFIGRGYTKVAIYVSAVSTFLSLL